jgi:quercetin dioxygenase-like cupin family protein
VKGRIRLSIGTEDYDAQPGDSWCIPSDVEHGAEIIEDSVGLEVFSPVREDYLPNK